MSFLPFIFAGIFCGFIDSCLGMGFGVTSASVLVTFGIAPAVASASVHTAEAFVDIFSAISHFKLGNVDLKISKHMLGPGIPAAVLGALFVSGLSLSVAKPFVRVVLLIMGLYIIRQSLLSGKTIKNNMNRSKAMILGFIASVVDVGVGGGWGPLGTPALIINGEDPKKAVGTIEFTEPIISLVAVITFGITLGFESFIWNITLPMIVGGIFLTPFASYLTTKIPKRTLGALIGLWLVLLNLWGLMS